MKRRYFTTEELKRIARQHLRSRVLRTLPSYFVEVMSPGQLLHHYLLASFAYYVLDESVWVDTAYDRICERLLECFDRFEHPHKHLTSIERLQEGTGYHLAESAYPTIVRSSIGNFFESINTGEFERAFRAQLERKEK